MKDIRLTPIAGIDRQVSPHGGFLDQFFIAPYVMDGSCEGTGVWRRADLSPRWLSFFAEFLADRPPTFEDSFPGPLAHLRLKFTAMRGAGLATFYVGANAAASLLLESGSDPSVEKFLAEKFVSSLASLDVVRAFGASEKPFSDVLELQQRPLMVVVPWVSDLISDQDYDLVRELGVHLAGVYLTVEPH